MTCDPAGYHDPRQPNDNDGEAPPVQPCTPTSMETPGGGDKRRDSDSSSSTVIYVGVAIGITVAVVIATILVLFLIYRRKHSKLRSPAVAYSAESTSSHNSSVNTPGNIYSTNDDITDGAKQQANDQSYEYISDEQIGRLPPDVVQHSKMDHTPVVYPLKTPASRATSQPNQGAFSAAYGIECTNNEYDLEKARAYTDTAASATEYTYAIRGDVTNQIPEVGAKKPEVIGISAGIEDVPDNTVMTDNELYYGDVVMLDNDV